MEETITIPVVIESKDNDLDLSFSYNEDVITIRLDGKEICKFDWEYNFQPAIKRMLEIWGVKEE